MYPLRATAAVIAATAMGTAALAHEVLLVTFPVTAVMINDELISDGLAVRLL
jgi:hypothetical protein